MIIYAGDGYVRSEAIMAIYLQKKESAKRIYATVVHSKTKADGHKDQGILLDHKSFVYGAFIVVFAEGLLLATPCLLRFGLPHQ